MNNNFLVSNVHADRPANLRRPLVDRRIARLEVLGRLRLRRRGGGRTQGRIWMSFVITRHITPASELERREGRTNGTGHRFIRNIFLPLYLDQNRVADLTGIRMFSDDMTRLSSFLGPSNAAPKSS